MTQKLDRRTAIKTLTLAGLPLYSRAYTSKADDNALQTAKLTKLFTSATSPFQLLVISADEFVQEMEPLLVHKNRTGITSHLISMSDIVGSLSNPASHPLAIKSVIAHGHQHFGVLYVMLVGDASKIPVRHRFVKQGDGGASEGLDGTYNPTDHYYANLYTAGDSKYELSDWDADGDGMYNLTTWTYDQERVDGSPRTNNPDKVDGFPHVAIGRLPAHTANDVRMYVTKVVEYELGMRSPPSSSFAFVCDQNLPGSPQSCDEMIRFSGVAKLPQTQIRKWWANTPKNSTPPWKSWTCFGTQVSKHDAMTKKWLVHVGHGSTNAWGVNLDDGQVLDDRYIRQQTESVAYPIVLSAGCDTGTLLNWAPQHKYRGLDPDQGYHFYFHKDRKKVEETVQNCLHPWPTVVPPPHPYDFPDVANRTFACAWLFGSATGGAIAYVGASLVQQGAVYGGALFARVLRSAIKAKVLGDAWVQGQRDYLNDKLFLDDILGSPRVYLSIQTLFGDPSLRLSPVMGAGVSTLVVNDRLTVFARNPMGTLSHSYYDPAANKWADWKHHNDGQLLSCPAAIIQNDRPTVFARNSHGTLSYKYWDAKKTTWSKWKDLDDGELASGPAVVNSGKRLFVFARDANGQLTHRHYDTSKRTWSGWLRIGSSSITSAPSAIVADERLTVFARLQDGRLGQTTHDSKSDSWTDWSPVTEMEITSAPSAVMTNKGIMVFALSSTGRLIRTYCEQPANRWSEWMELGAKAVSSPPCAAVTNGKLNVFAQATNGKLMQGIYDDKWSDWLEISNEVIS